MGGRISSDSILKQTIVVEEFGILPAGTEPRTRTAPSIACRKERILERRERELDDLLSEDKIR